MQDNKQELSRVTPLLAGLGYTLDEKQPHIGGERHLTGPLESGRKLILLGCGKDGKRVVIKISDDPKAIAEIEHECVCRDVLEKIDFARDVFLTPKELLFEKRGGYVLLVTEFIEQKKAFVERPTEEQFDLALKAFKAQEGAHAATYGHVRAIKNTFGEMRSADYLEKLNRYARETTELAPNNQPTAQAFEEAAAFVAGQKETLEQYCGFLTHWDFTPQNIRVHEGRLYLLDHSSLRFGNKYEGWARFINFMVLYNPPLASTLVHYVKSNRTPEESLSLKIMRAYRLAELIRYYAGWLPRTEGDLHALALARITFWTKVLLAVLDDKEVSADVIEQYKNTRDSLRSEEEKQRQQGLH